MAEKVELDTFKLPCHKLRIDIKTKLEELLKENQCQFAQDETTIGMMMIDTGDSKPVSQKLYPIAVNHYKWVKDEINKLLTAKLIWGSWSSWSALIIVVPKGDGGKFLVIDYHALNKITWKFIWPMPKVEDIFTNWMVWNTSQLCISEQDITTFHWMNLQYLKQPSLHHLENMNTSKYPVDLHKHLPIFRNSWQVP